jgi:hypothetical protein
MSRMMAIASLCYSLSGCSSLSDVAVVDTAPQHCKLLQELSFHRACDHERRIVPEDVKEFQRLARNLGADTIQCCRVAEDEEVLLLTNSRTGQMCTEARQRFASAYICGKDEK